WNSAAQGPAADKVRHRVASLLANAGKPYRTLLRWHQVRVGGSPRGARRPSPPPRRDRRRVDAAVRVRAGGRLVPPPPARGPARRPAVGGPARRSGQPTS